MACGILVPQPGIKLMPPALEAQSLNQWTAREVPYGMPNIILNWKCDVPCINSSIFNISLKNCILFSPNPNFHMIHTLKHYTTNYKFTSILTLFNGDKEARKSTYVFTVYHLLPRQLPLLRGLQCSVSGNISLHQIHLQPLPLTLSFIPHPH